MQKKSLFFLTIPLALAACNSAGTDSVKKADSANEAKADSNMNRPGMDSTGTGALAVDEPTSEFMVKAANDGMSEVEAARTAQEKAHNQRVKDFAAMMARDHSQANGELKSLARETNVTLPDSVSNDSKKMMTDLGKKSGSDFDKAYMKMMVSDHEKAVSLFEKNTDAKNASVKSWVDKTLPTLRMHLDSAKAIRDKLK